MEAKEIYKLILEKFYYPSLQNYIDVIELCSNNINKNYNDVNAHYIKSMAIFGIATLVDKVDEILTFLETNDNYIEYTDTDIYISDDNILNEYKGLPQNILSLKNKINVKNCLGTQHFRSDNHYKNKRQTWSRNRHVALRHKLGKWR